MRRVRLDVDAHVTSEPADRDEPPTPRTCHGGGTGPGEDRPTVVASEKRRCQVPHVAVYKAVAVKGIGDMRAAFDEELQDAASAEIVEHCGEVSTKLERRLHTGTWRDMAEHDPKRLAWRPGRTVVSHSEAWIVAPHGPGPYEHGVTLGAQAMNVAPGVGAGYPPARSIRRRRAPVESRGKLENDIGPAGRPVDKVRAELVVDGGSEHALGHRDACPLECPEPCARDTLVWVPERGDDPGDTGTDESVRARWRPAMVSTGLECHIDGGPSGLFACQRESSDLGVRPAGRCRRPFAHDLASSVNDDAADPWIGGRRRADALGKLDGPRHVAFVGATRLFLAQWGLSPLSRASA